MTAELGQAEQGGFLWPQKPCGVPLCAVAPLEDKGLFCSLGATELVGGALLHRSLVSLLTTQRS